MSVPMKTSIPLALLLAASFAGQSAAQTAPGTPAPHATGCYQDRDCDTTPDDFDAFPDDPSKWRSEDPNDPNRPQFDSGSPKVTVTLPKTRTASAFKSFSASASNKKTELAYIRVLITRTLRRDGKSIEQAYDDLRLSWFATTNPYKYRQQYNAKGRSFTVRVPVKGVKAGRYTVEIVSMNRAGKATTKKAAFSLR